MKQEWNVGWCDCVSSGQTIIMHSDKIFTTGKIQCPAKICTSGTGSPLSPLQTERADGVPRKGVRSSEREDYNNNVGHQHV